MPLRLVTWVLRRLRRLFRRFTHRRDGLRNNELVLVADHVAVNPASGAVFLRRTVADRFRFAAVDFYTEVRLEDAVYVISPLAVCVVGAGEGPRVIRLAEHPVFGSAPLLG